MSDEKKQAPIQTLRDGPIVVKIWQHDGKNGPYVTATLGRTYKNEETNEYGESRSLRGSDVLRAQALLGEANREMVRWRDYYKELGREAQPDQERAHDAEASAPTPDGATEKPAAVREDRPAQGLAAQRDAALATAKPNASGRNPDRQPER